MKSLELKVPPVLVFLVIAAAMYGLARALPAWTLVPAGRVAAGLALAAAGVAIALAGVAEFRRSRTTVHPQHPEKASAVVTSGVFRWTRNPMYLGLSLALAGWAIFLANPIALAGLPAFVTWMNRFQIAPEVRILSAKFGADFTRYLRSVRRWL